jgi:hypothetical protein
VPDDPPTRPAVASAGRPRHPHRSADRGPPRAARSPRRQAQRFAARVRSRAPAAGCLIGLRAWTVLLAGAAVGRCWPSPLWADRPPESRWPALPQGGCRCGPGRRAPRAGPAHMLLADTGPDRRAGPAPAGWWAVRSRCPGAGRRRCGDGARAATRSPAVPGPNGVRLRRRGRASWVDLAMLPAPNLPLVEVDVGTPGAASLRTRPRNPATSPVPGCGGAAGLPRRAGGGCPTRPAGPGAPDRRATGRSRLCAGARTTAAGSSGAARSGRRSRPRSCRPARHGTACARYDVSAPDAPRRLRPAPLRSPTRPDRRGASTGCGEHATAVVESPQHPALRS